MKFNSQLQLAGAAAALFVVGASAKAQVPIGGPITSPVIIANSPFFDPTLAVSPTGIQPLASGYYGPNGYYGPGYDSAANWSILRAAYDQGVRDALRATAPAPSESVEPAPNVDTTTGMTARPRGAVSRVPHGADNVRAWKVGTGQVTLRWQGDPRFASSVTFELTDRSGRVLRGTTVDQLPAEVKFTPPANAAYYQAIVHYVDGANNTIMGKLPR